jgi:hypothetical protein
MSWGVFPYGRTSLSSLLNPLLESSSLDPLLESSSLDPLLEPSNLSLSLSNRIISPLNSVHWGVLYCLTILQKLQSWDENVQWNEKDGGVIIAMYYNNAKLLTVTSALTKVQTICTCYLTKCFGGRIWHSVHHPVGCSHISDTISHWLHGAMNEITKVAKMKLF